MSDEHHAAPVEAVEASLKDAVAELGAVPAEDVVGRLEVGQRPHQRLTDRMTKTGGDGG